MHLTSQGINRRLALALLASTALAPMPFARATELPTGGTVAAGNVQIQQTTPSSLSMQQSTPSAVVNWQSFSVGQGGQVNIQQPSSSSTLLNRVTGSTTSTIAGQINANGQVFLVNPNGVVITPTGVVRTGSFVASTLGISDEDFLAGKYGFAGTGNSPAVVNQGTISVGPGGYAALIGGQVDNSGTIVAPLGKIGLGAGEVATLDVSGDGFLQVAVPSNQPDTNKALISHSGTLKATGGLVQMQAATARNLARQAINLTGVVEARSVSGHSGAIVLGGGDGGSVNIKGGRLDVSTMSGRRARATTTIAKGGAITVTGAAVALSGASLNASGRNGGGTIRVGGDKKGSGSLQQAVVTTVDAATRITANATDTGNGGSVVVWSAGATSYAGQIEAKGGLNGGNGGDVEVSGKQVLGFTGTVDQSAPKGQTGTLLLDPYDITVTDAAESNVQTIDYNTFLANFASAQGFTPQQINDLLAGTGQSVSATFNPTLKLATGTSSVINATTLATLLNSNDVILSTFSPTEIARATTLPGTQAGNVTFAAPLSWTSTSSLLVAANGSINVNAPITAPNGTLVLGTLSPTATITNSSTVTIGDFLALVPGSAAQFSQGSILGTSGTLISGLDTVPTATPLSLGAVPTSSSSTSSSLLPAATLQVASAADQSSDISLEGSGTSSTQARTAARETLNSIVRASALLEQRLAACDVPGQQPGARAGYTNCVSDVLDSYATAIDASAVQLPAALRSIPAVIRRTAQTVRRARTTGEARAAVSRAIVAVRKAISLVRATDGELAQIQRQQGATIASGLATVEARLVRATGL